MRIRAMKREERKRQIVTYLEVGAEKDKHYCPSAVMIAKGLDLSPSHHLRKILDEMVEEGKIMSFDLPSRGVTEFRRYYRLIPGRRGRPKRTREIVVKHNGEPVGMLQLLGFETGNE